MKAEVAKALKKLACPKRFGLTGTRQSQQRRNTASKHQRFTRQILELLQAQARCRLALQNLQRHLKQKGQNSRQSAIGRRFRACRKVHHKMCAETTLQARYRSFKAQQMLAKIQQLIQARAVPRQRRNSARWWPTMQCATVCEFQKSNAIAQSRQCNNKYHQTDPRRRH